MRWMYEKNSIPNINNGTIKTQFFFLQRVQSLEGGFTVIGDTQPVNTENISHKLKVKHNIVMLLLLLKPEFCFICVGNSIISSF